MHKRIKVLLVEDAAPDAELMIRALEGWEYAVEWKRVINCHEFSEALRTEKWDLVLADYLLPGFSGLEALEVVREIDPEMPLIMVSGVIGEDQAVAAMRAGAKDYVMKGNLKRLGPAMERELIDARERRERRLTELELENSRERWRVAFQTSPDSISINRLSDGLYVDVNDGFCSLTGYRKNEVIGKTTDEIDIWADEGDERSLLNVVEEQGYAENIRAEFKMKDGALRAGLFSARVIEISGCSYLMSITRDIHECEQSQRKYRLLAENIIDIIWALDRDMVVTYISPSVKTVLGFSPDEMVGQPVTDFLDEISAREALANAREMLGGTEVQSMTMDVPLRTKDGETVLAEISGSVASDLYGRSISLVGVARDITERRKTEESNRRLAVAVDGAGESILITDPQGVIIYVNPAFERVTGYRADEAIGEALHIFKRGIQDDDFYKEMWDTLECGQVWKGEISNRRKDGSAFDEEVTISPVRDKDGRLLSYVAVQRDVTERKALENQLLHAQKMEAIGTLAGGVAHDFNNLLTGILGYAELLKMDVARDEVSAEASDMILRAAERGAQLTKQLLGFARKGKQQNVPIDIKVAVRDVVDILRHTVAKGIKIKEEFAPEETYVEGDPGQINQVLMNLAVNASDAMGDSGTLRFSTRLVNHRERDVEEARVMLEVADTGRGISPELQGKVFDPFFTTKPLGEGTGLGLSTAYGIVQNHGGDIRVWSEWGKGSVFTIELPLTSNRPKREEAAVRDLCECDGVLVVDDEETVRSVLVRMLEIMNCRPIAVSDGESALRFVKENLGSLNLIILDWSMPGMMGLECLRRIREMDINVPVLVITGHAVESTSSLLKGFSRVSFLQKPFSLQILAQAMRELLL